MKIAVIPDTQVKPGQKFKFLFSVGLYIAKQNPDVIVHLGDFADMSSLSSYDRGTKDFEGRRYLADISAATNALQALEDGLEEGGLYSKCVKHMLLGNHEDRIARAVQKQPELDGLISLDDLPYRGYGWRVHDFLKVITVGGVAFSHYFVTGIAGRPASSPRAMLNKQHMSCVAGHQQGFQVHTDYNARGDRVTAIIAGSCYKHSEKYLGPQGNKHWNGVLILHEVKNGSFDLMPVSLNYIEGKYS